MKKMGRKPRGVKVTDLNAKIEITLHGRLRGISKRTGLSMRLHLEKALKMYLPKEHSNLDKRALELLE